MNYLQIGAYETLKEKNGEQNAIITNDCIDSIRGMSEERARNIFVSEDRLTAIL